MQVTSTPKPGVRSVLARVPVQRGRNLLWQAELLGLPSSRWPRRVVVFRITVFVGQPLIAGATVIEAQS